MSEGNSTTSYAAGKPFKLSKRYPDLPLQAGRCRSFAAED